MMEGTTRLSHSVNATYQNVADEAILIHLQSGVYYSLNEVGTVFWNLMDGTRTIADCADNIAAEYAAPREEVLQDLLDLADELAAEDLVVAA